MPIDWNEVHKILSPIKDYEDLSRRFQVSFSYPFARDAFNLSLSALIDYTQDVLGGDARTRYSDYAARLVATLAELEQGGVPDVLNLISRSETRQGLEAFVAQSGMDPQDIARLLKYLIYWFIPGEKYLSGLIRDDPTLRQALKVLGSLGVRTNLQLLQRGLTLADRQELAESSGLPAAVIDKLVNTADFSRLPWSSKATIANIIGAGYPSLATLAAAEPEQLYEDFFAYGKSIGKNLKLGNEIENSYRIAKIVPPILQA